MNGPVAHHERPSTRCATEHCRRNVVYSTGLCGPCQETANHGQFKVIDSYLPGIRAERNRK